MKQFIAFIRKEFYHILRDKRTMLILLGMPIVQIILFGFAISTEVKNVRTAILSPSYDIAVQQVAERLGANEYFQITEVVRSPEELQEEFRKGNIDLAVVFPSQYTNHSYKEGEAIQIIADASEPNLALTRSNYAQNILAQAESELKGISVQSAVIPNLKLLYNPQMKSAYNFVPGVMGLILMIICAMMTSVAIVREKDGDSFGIAGASDIRDSLQSRALFGAFVSQFGYHPAFVPFCIGCPGSGEYHRIAIGFFIIHLSLAGFGIIHLLPGTNTGGGIANLGYGTDDSDYFAFRNDIQHRKYAGNPTGIV